MDLFRPFDKVTYCGEKFRGELRGKLGIINSRVQNSDTTYVVDFGDQAYIMSDSSLKLFQAKSREEHAKAEHEIYFKRRHKNDEE